MKLLDVEINMVNYLFTEEPFQIFWLLKAITSHRYITMEQKNEEDSKLVKRRVKVIVMNFINAFLLNLLPENFSSITYVKILSTVVHEILLVSVV